MRYLKPNGTDLTVPVIAQGCMRIAEMTDAEVEALVKTDLENGIDFFDHADIYGRGACEARFGALLRRSLRSAAGSPFRQNAALCPERDTISAADISWTAWTAA